MTKTRAFIKNPYLALQYRAKVSLLANQTKDLIDVGRE
jgi:hypothetical protein